MMSPDAQNTGAPWLVLGPAITATPRANASPAISLVFPIRDVPVIDPYPSIAFDPRRA